MGRDFGIVSTGQRRTSVAETARALLRAAIAHAFILAGRPRIDGALVNELAAAHEHVLCSSHDRASGTCRQCAHAIMGVTGHARTVVMVERAVGLSAVQLVPSMRVHRRAVAPMPSAGLDDAERRTIINVADTIHGCLYEGCPKSFSPWAAAYRLRTP